MPDLTPDLIAEVDFETLHIPVIKVVAADVIIMLKDMKLDITPEEAVEIVEYVKDNIKINWQRAVKKEIKAYIEAKESGQLEKERRRKEEEKRAEEHKQFMRMIRSKPNPLLRKHL